MVKGAKAPATVFSKPIFWGIAGSMVLGGIAYVVSRDNANNTIIRKDDNAAKTGSTDTTTSDPVSTVTVTPNLLTVTATQLTYSNVVNGSILTLYKNGVTTGLTKTADGNPWTGLTNILNASYKLIAKEGTKTDSALSNSITYTTTPIVIVPPSQGVAFPSFFQNVPVITVKNSLPLNVFPDFTTPYHANSIVGADVPNIMITLHTGADKLFYNQGVSFKNRGFLGSGYVFAGNGVVGLTSVARLNRCTQFIYTQDPNTGLPWAVDTQCNIPIATFQTSLPYNERLHLSSPRTNNDTFFDSASDQDLINEGSGVATNTYFGSLPDANGKNQVIWINFDWENAYVTGSNPHKARRFLKSAADKLKGFLSPMYLMPIGGLISLGYVDPNSYPDANGNFADSQLNPIFVGTESMDGIANYSVLSHDNILYCPEISQWQEASFPQGYNDGFRIINHFGSNATAEHYLAKVINICEVNYAYLRSKGKAHCMGAQVKNVCDRGNLGLQYTNGSRPDGRPKTTSSKEYLTRSQTVQAMLMTFMSGVYNNNIWDDPLIDAVLDSYYGIIGSTQIMDWRKDFSNLDLKSFADLRLTGEFDLWDTEVSYDGGVNYVKEKGSQYQETSSRTECRTMRSGNYLVICACRAYEIEPENITVRYKKNGFNFTKAITSADWKSVYPNGTDKSYYFEIFKMA